MRNGLLRALIPAFAAVSAVSGQVQLYLVGGSSEQPASAIYDFGNVEPGVSASVQFRMRNTGAAPTVIDLLAVGGSGFTLSGMPQLPLTLAPQKSFDFTVQFASNRTGSYSASLDSVGVSILLTANVPVELTSTVDSGAAARPLGAAPVDFGNVERNSKVTRRVTLANQTNLPLAVPAISISAGAGFSISGPAPGGLLLQPVETAGFDVQFSPVLAGAANGSLIIGAHSYRLLGNGVEPSLPAPRLSVTLPQSVSAQQGAVTVNLDTPSKTSGLGTVTIAFRSSPGGYADPTVALGGGGQSVTFTVAPGDTQGHFAVGTAVPFQTGTTAGTLTIAVELGGGVDQQTILIPPAPVGLTNAQAQRSSGNIEVDLTGFDNTRTAGQLTFTFYDAAGNAIAPGAIHADSTAGFASYFQSSAGGAFVLKALFPVNGDASQIRAFEAAVTNSNGTAKTALVSF